MKVQAEPEVGAIQSNYATITFSTPYVSRTLALLVTKEKDAIPEDYKSSLYTARSDANGNITLKLVFILKGYYYSLIEPQYGTFNPIKGTVYKAML